MACVDPRTPDRRQRFMTHDQNRLMSCAAADCRLAAQSPLWIALDGWWCSAPSAFCMMSEITSNQGKKGGKEGGENRGKKEHRGGKKKKRGKPGKSARSLFSAPLVHRPSAPRVLNIPSEARRDPQPRLGHSGQCWGLQLPTLASPPPLSCWFRSAYFPPPVSLSRSAGHADANPLVNCSACRATAQNIAPH